MTREGRALLAWAAVVSAALAVMGYGIANGWLIVVAGAIFVFALLALVADLDPGHGQDGDI